MNAKQWITATLLLLAVACTKQPDTPGTDPGPGPQETRLKKMEMSDNYLEVSYNTDGTIALVTNRLSSNNSLSNSFSFSYSNGQLTEVGYGPKWKYYYTNGQITKVETINDANVSRYLIELTYAGGKIAEKKESLVNGTTVSNFMRSNYTYTAAGNLDKVEVFQFINQQWKKSEEIRFTAYDNHVNTTESFENYPWLPLSVFSTNNPLKQEYYDDQGTLLGTTTYVYTYNTAGLPATRTSTEKFIGFPEVVDVVKMYY
jgi:hypothetical protein